MDWRKPKISLALALLPRTGSARPRVTSSVATALSAMFCTRAFFKTYRSRFEQTRTPKPRAASPQSAAANRAPQVQTSSRRRATLRRLRKGRPERAWSSHAPARAARTQRGSRSSLIGRQYPSIVPSSASRPPAAARCVHAGAGSRRTFHAMSFGEGIRRRELTRGTARAREAGSAAPAGANAAAGAAAAAQQAAKSAIECMLSRRRPRSQNL